MGFAGAPGPLPVHPAPRKNDELWRRPATPVCGASTNASCRGSRRPAPLGDGRWQDNDNGPARFGALQRDQPTLLEADHLPAGIARQQGASQRGEMRQMTDQHHVSGLAGKPLDPGSRVVVGGEAVILLRVDTEQRTPDLRCLAARVLPEWTIRSACTPSRLVARRATLLTSSAPSSVSGRSGSSSADLASPCWTRNSLTAETVGVSETLKSHAPRGDEPNTRDRSEALSTDHALAPSSVTLPATSFCLANLCSSHTGT